MKISEILKQRRFTLSFEIFPPKETTKIDSVLATADALVTCRPDFISITYGAGGSTSKNTAEIAGQIHGKLGGTALAHLTCVSSTKEELANIVDDLEKRGIENILALRGDIPKEGGFCAETADFRHADQLAAYLLDRGDFCIGGACYPEGHVECPNKELDMDRLKSKVEAGCSFLITQMFFDNNILYNFLYRLSTRNIQVPVIAGIMPVTNTKQIRRIISLSGAVIPEKFRGIVDRFESNPAALWQAGVVYATEQIVDLIANGVRGVHIYTMNKPEIARAIVDNISEIVKDR